MGLSYAFFYASGMVFQYPVPENNTVTGRIYAENISPAMSIHYLEAPPQTGVSVVTFLP